MVMGHIAQGVKIVISQRATLANHKPETEPNARNVFDEDRNTHTVVAKKSISSGEETFCDYRDKYQRKFSLYQAYSFQLGIIKHNLKYYQA